MQVAERQQCAGIQHRRAGFAAAQGNFGGQVAVGAHVQPPGLLVLQRVAALVRHESEVDVRFDAGALNVRHQVEVGGVVRGLRFQVDGVFGRGEFGGIQPKREVGVVVRRPR